MTDKDKAQISRLVDVLEETARLMVVHSMGTRTFEYDEASIQLIDDILSKKPNFQRLLSLILSPRKADVVANRPRCKSSGLGGA
jgi:hypothetical protein